MDFTVVWMDPEGLGMDLGSTLEGPGIDPGWTIDGPGMDITHLYLNIILKETSDSLSLELQAFLYEEAGSLSLDNLVYFIYLFVCLWTLSVNFSLKCIYSYRYERILLILDRNHP